MNLVMVNNAVMRELMRAQSRFPAFNSAHEGYAVILEELDELWDEVKLNQSKRNVSSMAEEAIQVAAMAMRFLFDCCADEDLHEQK